MSVFPGGFEGLFLAADSSQAFRVLDTDRAVQTAHTSSDQNVELKIVAFRVQVYIMWFDEKGEMQLVSPGFTRRIHAQLPVTNAGVCAERTCQRLKALPGFILRRRHDCDWRLDQKLWGGGVPFCPATRSDG